MLILCGLDTCFQRTIYYKLLSTLCPLSILMVCPVHPRRCWCTLKITSIRLCHGDCRGWWVLPALPDSFRCVLLGFFTQPWVGGGWWIRNLPLAGLVIHVQWWKRTWNNTELYFCCLTSKFAIWELPCWSLSSCLWAGAEISWNPDGWTCQSFAANRNRWPSQGECQTWYDSKGWENRTLVFELSSVS